MGRDVGVREITFKYPIVLSTKQERARERERERDVWSVKSRGYAMGSWRLSGRNVPSLPKQITEKGLRPNRV